MIDYYKNTRSITNLRSAWKKVRASGVVSRSKQIRDQVNEFDLRAEIHLQRISRQLRENRFQFEPAEGVLQDKPGKKGSRPIVIAPIENRIVQRAILNVLQSHIELQKKAASKNSFGGIKGRGVQAAITLCYSEMHRNGKYFIRSDIKAFFTKIPKKKVIGIIACEISSTKFLNLFKEAMNVELSNMDRLGQDVELFPIYEIGVAQGCCLSPFIGNLLLHEFDNELNYGDVTCIRYIDDFMLLAPTRQASNRAFNKALKLLKSLGLSAYHPSKDKEKAEQGYTQSGKIFSLLGCEIRPGIIRPDKKSVHRIKSSISGLFNESFNMMANPGMAARKRLSLVDTLHHAGNVLRAWGNQYSFCNDHKLLEEIDDFVDIEIGKYMRKYQKRRKNLDNKHMINRRNLLGVHVVSSMDLSNSIASKFHGSS